MTSRVAAEPMVERFRLAVSRATRAKDVAPRLAAAIEHLEGWADARIRTLHEGEFEVHVLVEPCRPVRLQAARDIATTCPYYVGKSFKPLG